MAQLKITQAQATTLTALRTVQPDTDRKAAKKSIFTDIKTQFAIPSGVRLKVEVDNRASLDYLVLKDKVTGRELVGAYGTDKLVFIGVAPAPTTAPVAPTSTARFSTAVQPALQVRRIAVSLLLGIVRDGGDGDDATLPAGAPALADDGTLLDNQDGFVYFKA